MTKTTTPGETTTTTTTAPPAPQPVRPGRRARARAAREEDRRPPRHKPPAKLPPDVSYVAPTTTLPFGEALLGAVNGLDKSSGGTSSMWAWALGVLLLAAIPPVVFAIRRRRSRAALEQGP